MWECEIAKLNVHLSIGCNCTCLHQPPPATHPQSPVVDNNTSGEAHAPAMAESELSPLSSCCERLSLACLQVSNNLSASTQTLQISFLLHYLWMLMLPASSITSTQCTPPPHPPPIRTELILCVHVITYFKNLNVSSFQIQSNSI